jgi:DNA primase
LSRIPRHFIDELIARADIVDVIGSRVPLKKAGREFKACCPFHGEKTPSFTVSQAKQFYHCFGCGAHGTALGFLMEYDRLGFVEAVEELASRLGLEIPREAGGGERRETGRDELYELMGRVAQFYRDALKGDARAVEYLKVYVTGETAAISASDSRRIRGTPSALRGQRDRAAQTFCRGFDRRAQRTRS